MNPKPLRGPLITLCVQEYEEEGSMKRGMKVRGVEVVMLAGCGVSRGDGDAGCGDDSDDGDSFNLWCFIVMF